MCECVLMMALLGSVIIVVAAEKEKPGLVFNLKKNRQEIPRLRDFAFRGCEWKSTERAIRGNKARDLHSIQRDAK